MADPLNKWSKLLKQITKKQNKTDADHEEMAHIEFLGALYLDENGPIIPAFVMDAVIIKGAMKNKEGPLAKPGVYCSNHCSLEYDGPRDPEELWLNEQFRFTICVVRNRNRVSVTRPIFRNWMINAIINVEDKIVDPGRVYKWLTDAGIYCGIGDWRPQYGRFTVERLNGK